MSITHDRPPRRASRPVLLATLASVLMALPLSGTPGLLQRTDRATRIAAEGQRRADRGDGTFVNPIFAGEFPDPTVVRVGADYYMTHTSGTASPGLFVWHSRDLINWEPLGPAITQSPGDVWAPDIVHLNGLFYIYFPALVTDAAGKGRRTNFVVTAKNPAGPWSDPVDLGVGGIDPGHVVDARGQRFLYLDDGKVAPLSENGLSLAGPARKVYDGWEIPVDWNVECKCLESPKLFTRNGFYYLVSAQGGTAGPSTSHMIVVARSRSPLGPWENMPANPLLRTAARSERWWSQGHGTIIDGIDGRWWVVYHAFENGYRTLGRQTLLLPVEWTSDGWPRIPCGIDASHALKKPAGDRVDHGLPLSDTFETAAAGWQWRRWEPRPAADVYRRGDAGLQVTARGAGPADAALLTLAPLNHAYEVQVEVAREAGAEGGILLHYDGSNFAGIGVGRNGLRTFLKGKPLEQAALPPGVSRVLLKIRNIEHDVRMFYSVDGARWVPFETGMDLSGYHHDTLRNWSWLKVGLYAAGEGTVTFRDFRYRGF
jgi:beta-xylosidase